MSITFPVSKGSKSHHGTFTLLNPSVITRELFGQKVSSMLSSLDLKREASCGFCCLYCCKNIVRKLNSYARYAGLKKALFEYNKILKSTHILNLIDDMSLRRAIRTARNRTEAYHQLQGLIRKIYSGIFKGKKIVDNRESAHAVRLVANCIIAYNSIILNTVYEKMLKEGTSEKIIQQFARISPIAWVHIAFTGKYNFKKSTGLIDLTVMANMLERHVRQQFWKG